MSSESFDNGQSMKDELPQKPDLQTVIDALVEGDTTTVLYGLSDISATEAKSIEKKWQEVPLPERRKLLHQMVEASETDFTLSYDEFGKINLDDPNADIRSAAIDALWANESVEYLRRLHKIARADKAIQVRVSAVSALGKFILLGEYEEIPEQEIEPVVTTLVDIWSEKNNPVELRRRALEAISNGNHEIIPDAIKEAYNSDNPQMKISAIFAMGASYDNQWDDIVLGELDNEDPEVAYEAAKASGALSIDEAVPKLGKLATSGDREILEVVVSSLGEIGNKEAIRILNILAEQAEEQDDDDLSEAIDEAIAIASLMGGDMFAVDFE